MAKYTPIYEYLSGLPQSKNELTLSFGQIERIIGDRLPKSAHEYRPWWGNEQSGSHVQAKSWMNAGWKVDEVNLLNQWVRLVRD